MDAGIYLFIEFDLACIHAVSQDVDDKAVAAETAVFPPLAFL